MPITETQLERRKKHLGSSDIAAILGLDPYKTAYDVWAMKTGRLPDDEGGEAAMLGKYLEPSVLDYAQDKLGQLIQNQYRSVKAQGIPIGANVDAIVVATGEPVEAKTSGILWRTDEMWGEADSDQVPDRVLIQSHVHMLCTEKDVCHVIALLAGRGFVSYQVNRDATVIEVITDTAKKFWEDFVKADTPPDNSLPTATTIKKMRRTPESIVPIDAQLVKRWHRLGKIQGKIKKKRDAAQIEMLAALGDAEAGECEIGLLTYFLQARAETVVKASKFRVARLKEFKEQK